MAKKLYGTDPDQVPTNADLGTIAYQNKDSVTVDTLGVGTSQQDAEGLRLLVAHDGHGIGIDYVGALPTQAGIFTSSTAHTQTGYGDLNIKARTDYGGYYGIGFFTASSNDTPVRRAYFNSTGNLVFESGKGIDFSASQGSGASASVLDDYEEGTFSPYFSGTGATGSFTYTIQNGYYEKVGNICHARGYLNVASVISNYTGTLRISGLPFNVASNTNIYSAVSMGYSNSWATAAPQAGHSNPGTNTAALKYFDSLGNTVDVSAGLAAGDALIFDLTYRTT